MIDGRVVGMAVGATAVTLVLFLRQPREEEAPPRPQPAAAAADAAAQAPRLEPPAASIRGTPRYAKSLEMFAETNRGAAQGLESGAGVSPAARLDARAPVLGGVPAEELRAPAARPALPPAAAEPEPAWPWPGRVFCLAAALVGIAAARRWAGSGFVVPARLALAASAGLVCLGVLTRLQYDGVAGVGWVFAGGLLWVVSQQLGRTAPSPS